MVFTKNEMILEQVFKKWLILNLKMCLNFENNKFNLNDV